MSRNTPVTVKGTNYPSIRAACHALGIPYQTAYIQAKRHCTSIQWELEHSTFNLQPVAISLPVYEYTSRSGKVYRVNSIPDLKRVIYRDYERGAIRRSPSQYRLHSGLRGASPKPGLRTRAV